MTDIITAKDKLNCAKRELAFRKRVYPHYRASGKMSAGRMVHEIACIEAMIHDYEIAVEEEKRHG